MANNPQLAEVIRLVDDLKVPEDLAILQVAENLKLDSRWRKQLRYDWAFYKEHGSFVDLINEEDLPDYDFEEREFLFMDEVKLSGSSHKWRDCRSMDLARMLGVGQETEVDWITRSFACTLQYTVKRIK